MDDDAILEILERYPVLAALDESEEAPSRRELVDRLGLSKSSVYRIVTSLEEKGLVEENEDGVVLTPLGRTVVRETAGYREALQTADEVAEFVDVLPLEGRDLELDDLDRVRITKATEEQPMAPLLRLAEVTETAEETRVLTNTVAPQSFDVGRQRVLDGEMEAHLVLEETAARTLVEKDWYSESLRQDLEQDELTIRVAEQAIPYQLGIMDDVVCLGADGSGSMPIGLLEAENPALREWAHEEFAAYRDEAAPIDEVFDLS